MCVAYISVARGCTGFICTSPQGGEKNWGPNLLGKVVSSPPRQSKSPIFEEIGEIWPVEEVI